MVSSGRRTASDQVVDAAHHDALDHGLAADLGAARPPGNQPGSARAMRK